MRSLVFTSLAASLVSAALAGDVVVAVNGTVTNFCAPLVPNSTGAMGSFQIAVDNRSPPQPNGKVAAQAGEQWNFQAWHRHSLGGQALANFADAVAVTFLQAYLPTNCIPGTASSKMANEMPHD